MERGDFPDAEGESGSGDEGQRHGAAGGPFEADEEDGDDEDG